MTVKIIQIPLIREHIAKGKITIQDESLLPRLKELDVVLNEGYQRIYEETVVHPIKREMWIIMLYWKPDIGT